MSQENLKGSLDNEGTNKMPIVPIKPNMNSIRLQCFLGPQFHTIFLISLEVKGAFRINFKEVSIEGMWIWSKSYV